MLALLANPDSGSGEAEEVERMLRERGIELRRFGLGDPSAVVAARPERVVVAGGDGSVGCGAAAAAAAAVPLAVVPVGTANDFARALDVPLATDSAIELALTGSRTRRLDLGRVGERPFVNAASAGLSPVAAREAHGLKARLGPLAYAVGAARAALTADPIRCRVRCDGSDVFAGGAWQVSVGITGAFGGGSQLDANPQDGILDVVVVEAGSRARLIQRAYGMRAGRIEGQSGVTTASGSSIEVHTDAATGFNVDGELLEARDLRFTIEPGAFEVIVG